MGGLGDRSPKKVKTGGVWGVEPTLQLGELGGFDLRPLQLGGLDATAQISLNPTLTPLKLAHLILWSIT